MMLLSKRKERKFGSFIDIPYAYPSSTLACGFKASNILLFRLVA